MIVANTGVTGICSAISDKHGLRTYRKNFTYMYQVKKGDISKEKCPIINVYLDQE